MESSGVYKEYKDKMEYKQARDFIKETGTAGIIFGLDSIRSLMERLGNVQEQVPYVHVAGTNGKGSVCAMLAQILMACGYRTGIYASPAVFEPEEIIKINGEPVSKERFAGLIERVQRACVSMEQDGLRRPTAFEVETAAAFCYFQEENCEIVLLEAGMGGSLDATNLIAHPFLSILTSVSIDHRAYLGDTLCEIAAAKCGIIKPGCPCVTARQQPQVLEVIKKAAAEKESELWKADSSVICNFAYDAQESRFETAGMVAAGEQEKEAGMESSAAAAGQEKTDSMESGMAAAEQEKAGIETALKSEETYDTEKMNCLAADLHGIHGTLALTGACQRENLACVLTAVSLLKGKGLRITSREVLEGLSKVRLPGRFERIRTQPEIYIDGAHNEGAALRLRETVQNCLAGRRVVLIIGVFADKEYKKVLKIMLPCAAAVFTVTPDHPRALDGRILAQQAAEYHTAVSYVPGISQAVRLAEEAAGTGGAVLAFGSFSYLKELKQAVKDE